MINDLESIIDEEILSRFRTHRGKRNIGSTVVDN